MTDKSVIDQDAAFLRSMHIEPAQELSEPAWQERMLHPDRYELPCERPGTLMPLVAAVSTGIYVVAIGWLLLRGMEWLVRRI